MSTEFIIGTGLSVLGIIIGIVIYFLQKTPPPTKEQVKEMIINHLMKNAIKTDPNRISVKVIQPIINHKCAQYKMPSFEISEILDGLIYEYENNDLVDTTNIVDKLSDLNDVIQGKATKVIKSSETKKRYGKPIKEYIKDVYDELEFDKEYLVDDIKSNLSKLVKEKSKEDLDKVTQNCQMYAVIVNEPNRVHYGITAPLVEKNNLFFYVDENKKGIVKKFQIAIKENPNIYWKENGSKLCKKLAELRK